MWCACGSQHATCAFLDARLAHSVYCVMSAVLDVCGSVGQECKGVSCLQELQQKLRETIVLLMQHEQAYDLAEAWAVRIADEVTAHKQAIQQVEDAKLRLSAQPTSNSAAASLSKREQHLTQLRRRFERVSAETWSTVFRFSV